MGLLDKILGKRDDEQKKSTEMPKVEVSSDGNSLKIGDVAKITF